MATPGNILVIGDADESVKGAVTAALPSVRTVSAAAIFDGLAELRAGTFSAVFAAIEPVERRPEAAVRALREMAGEGGRVILFGHPTLEPLSRKMLSFGCDDYVLTPADPAEIRALFESSTPRAAAGRVEAATVRAADDDEPTEPTDPVAPGSLADLPVAQIVLDALLHAPQKALRAAVDRLNQELDPSTQLALHPAGEAVDGPDLLTHALHDGAGESGLGTLSLTLPPGADESAAARSLADLSGLLGKVAALDDRHARMQKLAITDDLTGLHNGRWFRHFLDKILVKARTERFPVTLLLFDIDNFKQYNDKFGHGVGDEILRQTGALMKRTCRSHDLVCRIAGDEFAVIFWDKEGPRKPLQPGAKPGFRGNQTPVQIAQRFRKLLNSDEFTALGGSGRGSLSISGGMAVYPYDARDAESLIAAADEALMFGAKRSGKDAIYLVGGEAAGGEE